MSDSDIVEMRKYERDEMEQELESLRTQNKLLIEALKSYGDKENWTKCYEYGDEYITEDFYVEIDRADIESDPCQFSLINKWGGKRARECLKAIGEMK